MFLCRLVLLSLHMCVGVTAWMHSSGDGYQLQCGFVDNENVCTVKDNETVLIPCGQFPQQFGVSYTYYILGSTEALAEGITEYLSLNVSRTDNGIRVCCKPNVSASFSDNLCYRLNITYAPVEVSLEWPRGYSKWPVFGEPYGLTCPLEGNPNATYQWKKYSNLDYVERVNITSGVKFSEDGRSWQVDAYHPEVNGLYTCTATNVHGTATYHDDNLFYLYTEKCFRGRLGNPSIEISPTSSSNYPEGTTVELNCTALFVDYTSEKPSWYKINGSDYVYCDGPEYEQIAEYDNGACKWSNDLTIYNFTERHTGEYACGGYVLNTKSLTLDLSVDMQERDSKTLSTSAVATVLPVTFFLMVFIVCAIIKVIQNSKRPSYTKSKEPPYNGFTYDVFISAHDEAREFVQDQILQPLEHQCNPPFKVCWHLRDFIAGIPITEQIADAVLQSRKIIFVFSTHFMDSTFCQIELQHSLHRLFTTHTRCIVPITLSDQCVPKKVKNILTYWPIIPADEDKMMGKICHFLGFPMEEIVIDMEDETLLH